MNENISVNMIELHEALAAMFDGFEPETETAREGYYTMERERSSSCPGNAFYSNLKWDQFDTGSNAKKLAILVSSARAYLRRVMAKLSLLPDGREFREGFTEKILKHLPCLKVKSWNAAEDAEEYGSKVYVGNCIVPYSAGSPDRWLLLEVEGATESFRQLFVPIGRNTGDYITKAKNLRTWWLRDAKETSKTVVADIGYSFAIVFLVSLIRETLETGSCSVLTSYIDSELDELISSRMEGGVHYMPQGRFPLFDRESECVPYESLFSQLKLTYLLRDGCSTEEIRAYREKSLLVWLKAGSGDRLLEQVKSCVYRSEGTNMFYVNFCNEIPKLFMMCFRKYTDLKDNEEYDEALKKEHALWFMDLKGLPQKYRDAAEKSLFRGYFNKVEYDSDILLVNGDAGFTYTAPDGASKELPLFNDFKVISDMLGWRFNDLTLRFRKLGNHHASGLYGDFAKTVCIDFRTPGSFAHELFHAYDYQKAMLSQSSEFMEIRSWYESLLKKALNSAGLKLKGKYNLRYYLKATEVFARCGELYLTACCGIANACIQPSETAGFAYPKDEKFLGKIRKYYDGLFQKESTTAGKTA